VAETYKIKLLCMVNRGGEGTDINEDIYYFPDQSFAKMSMKVAQFYDLITKLQKEK
jgi:hypothetical protein